MYVVDIIGNNCDIGYIHDYDFIDDAEYNDNDGVLRMIVMIVIMILLLFMIIIILFLMVMLILIKIII